MEFHQEEGFVYSIYYQMFFSYPFIIFIIYFSFLLYLLHWK